MAIVLGFGYAESKAISSCLDIFLTKGTDMSFLDDKPEKVNIVDLSTFYFVRLFRGFSLSVQPGKMVLAILAIAMLYAAGWFGDLLAGPDHSVVSSTIYDFNSGSEISWYAENNKTENNIAGNIKNFRMAIVDSYTDQLIKILREDFLKDVIGDNPLELVRSGQIYGILQQQYVLLYEEYRNKLEARYLISRDNTIAGFETSKKSVLDNDAEFDFQQVRLLDAIDDKYSIVRKAMVSGFLDPSDEQAINAVITADVSKSGDAYSEDLLEYKDVRDNVKNTILLARAMKIALAMEGKGVFQAFTQFVLIRTHNLAVNLVLLDFTGFKDNIYDLAFGTIWMVKNHTLYVIFIYLAAFSIYSVLGGAICRISAMQITRQEHVGAIEALQFSLRRFKTFMMVPIVPTGVIVVIGFIIAVAGLPGLIPYFGPAYLTVIMAVLFFLGCLMTIVIIGLIVGHGLMYPAVAVDNADAFDAMSRAFTYILHRPWHLAAYAFIASVYGIICYVFLRSFILIVFAVVRTSLGPWWDIDAVWPLPSFTNLLPEIQWHLLCCGGAPAATIIRAGCLLFALLLPAYAYSYYYTTATQIYVFLRKHEDGVELDECYLETHIDALFDKQTWAPVPSESDMDQDIDQDQDEKTD